MNEEDPLLDSILRSIEISQSGYGGLDKNGHIVDRRENPDSVPIKKNRAWNIPNPKKRWVTTTPQEDR